MTNVFALDAISGAPTYTGQQTRQLFSAFLGTAPSGRPLGSNSGVRPGTPTTTAVMSGAGDTTWTVKAHSGVIDAEASATAGPYIYATDGTDTGTITTASSSYPRIDLLYIQISDTVQDGSGGTGGTVGYLAGTAASSPAVPTTPARSLALAQISVPVSGGGNPSVTWVAPTFSTNGGLLYQCGTVNITPSAANVDTTVTVTFPTPFSAVPTVFANCYVVSPSSVFLEPDTPTTTSMQLTLFRPNTTTTTCSWAAFGLA